MLQAYNNSGFTFRPHLRRNLVFERLPVSVECWINCINTVIYTRYVNKYFPVMLLCKKNAVMPAGAGCRSFAISAWNETQVREDLVIGIISVRTSKHDMIR